MDHDATTSLTRETQGLVDALGMYPQLAPLIAPLEALYAQGNADQIECFGIVSGTTLFHEGDAADHVYILTSGRLGVFVGSPRSAMPVSLVAPGEFVGEMGLISSEPRSATVIALRDCDLVKLPKHTTDALIAADPRVAQMLLRLLASRLRKTTRSHRLAEAVQAVAVVPLGRAAIDPDVIPRLISAWGALFGRTHVITRETAGGERELLDSIGAGRELAVYLAGGVVGAWSRHCIRQSDRVVFLADAAEDAAGIDRELIDLARALHRPADVILVHGPEVAVPACGGSWLDKVPSQSILHLRVGRDNDHARVARLIACRAVGLVFSGGGARGFAHLGALRALQEAGIEIDLVGGTSMGALVAGLCAMEIGVDEMLTRFEDVFVRHNPFNDYVMPFVSLARGRKMNRMLSHHFGDVRIEDLWKTMFCVSANLTSGAPHIHRSGPIWHALRASAGIPGIFPPWIEAGQILVDGGIIDNFPTAQMSAMRRGPVIGIEVCAEATFDATADHIEDRSLAWLIFSGRRQVPSMLRTLMRVATINGEEQRASARRAADFVIRPDVGRVPMLSFKDHAQIVDAGYQAARAAIPHINAMISDARSGRSR